SAAARAVISAGTAATPSSASPRPAPSSKSHFGTTWATDLPSQVPMPFRSCQKSSSPEPNHPDRHHFCPSYDFIDPPKVWVTTGSPSLCAFKGACRAATCSLDQDTARRRAKRHAALGRDAPSRRALDRALPWLAADRHRLGHLLAALRLVVDGRSCAGLGAGTAPAARG